MENLSENLDILLLFIYSACKSVPLHHEKFQTYRNIERTSERSTEIAGLPKVWTCYYVRHLWTVWLRSLVPLGTHKHPRNEEASSDFYK